LFNNFFVKPVLLTLLSYAILYFFIHFNFIQIFWGRELLPLFFFSIALTVKTIAFISSLKPQAKEQVLYSLVTIVLKFLLHLVIIIIYFIPKKELSISFLVCFLTFFLLFTVFDLFELFKKNREISL